MKKSVSFLIIMWLLIIPWHHVARAAEKQSSDSITVYSSPELLNISATWAGEYNKSGGRVKISVLPARPDGSIHLADGSIGFVSNEYFPAFDEKNLWKMTVGRDVIVPVINSANPFLAEIMKKGIPADALAMLLSDNDNRSWGKLLKNDRKDPVHLYFVNENQVMKVMKSFTNTGNAEVKGQGAEDGKEVISALQKDPYGIAFVRLVSAVDFSNQKLAGSISLLPIDRNNNGTLDYNEDFYEDLNLFARGIWIGKYPKNLFSNIYSVSSGQPENEATMAFLKWVLVDGQQYLYSSGYSDLLAAERQSSVDRLYTPVINPEKSSAPSPLLAIAIIFVALAALIFMADALIRLLQKKGAAPSVSTAGLQHKLNEESMLVPRGLFFDKTHTWAFMEQNGLVKVGLDDFLQHITGTITRIKMKNPGDTIKKGDYIMTLMRNGKQLNLYSPVSGTIREVNRNLESDSSLLNSSPYNLGWVYRIEPANWIKDIQLLFMSDKYTGWLKSEFGRMKDFLAIVLSRDSENYSRVVLQDGGEIVDSTLADLGPEIWDDFQTKFIDASR